ncbi:MAG: polyribonucleotide nucleotidyltransferase [Cyanobacteria bacterium P01_H01_bin.74]
MNEQILFPNKQSKTLTIGKHTVSIETGMIAKSAQGSVILRCDETVLLVTATGSENPRAGIDFFPLLIDVEERLYAVGRLPGGYLKREGKPTDKATLMARLIDRPIRPLWPEGFKNDVQVVVSTLSLDGETQPDVLAIFGASLALELSGLPFDGPIGGVRVGRVNGEFVLNPTFSQSEKSDLDLVVAGTESSIMMVEAGAEFVSEADLLEALAFAHTHIKSQVAVQKEFAAQCGVEKTAFVFEHKAAVEQVEAFARETVEEDINKAYHEFDRDARKVMLAEAKEKLTAALEEKPDDDAMKLFLAEQTLNFLGESFKKIEKSVMRTMIMEESVRADGRMPEDIRPINCQVSLLPRVHGSGLFTRGNTQALSVATLGGPGEAQKFDGVDPLTEKRWLHHYSFPGFSVGEVKPMRGAGRREIGHGLLVERGLAPVIPSKEAFGYTIRVNSDILESNGSTSMASTCGSTLALMDAGVPIKAPVGGIAMGLIKEGDRSIVLSDIQGVEDFLGDMDFKVVGTREGVTALQMDIKIQGISLEIMKTALEQAKTGRMFILDRLAEAISAPRPALSKYAPKIVTLSIDKEMIGSVIGPGGKMIRSIIEETGANIDIEDSGLVTITATGGDGAEKAQEIIERLTRKVERGMLVKGKVVRIIPIGAFVELFAGKDGMVHISQLAPYRVQKVEDILKVDQEVLVKVIDIDDRGRINLTIKGVTDEERAEHGFEPLNAVPSK